MVNVQNIHSLTEFKRNANSYIETIRSTKAPIVITVNGEAAVVVQDAIEYQALIDRLDVKGCGDSGDEVGGVTEGDSGGG